MDPEGLVGRRVWCGEGYPCPLGEGLCPLLGKKIFYLKLRVLMHSERYFLSVSCQKNVEFSA